MNHVCRWWYDERFLARPYGVACSCGWPCSGGGCFPDQADAEEAIEHHKQRWAEAEAKLRRRECENHLENARSKDATTNITA